MSRQRRADLDTLADQLRAEGLPSQAIAEQLESASRASGSRAAESKLHFRRNHEIQYMAAAEKAQARAPMVVLSFIWLSSFATFLELIYRAPLIEHWPPSKDRMPPVLSI